MYIYISDTTIVFLLNNYNQESKNIPSIGSHLSIDISYIRSLEYKEKRTHNIKLLG